MSTDSESTSLLRQVLPFGLRVGLRRLPHAMRWLARRPPVQRALDPREWSHVQCARSSPLRRQSTAYDQDMQRAKEHNVHRAAALLDGVVIPAGGTLSWHAVVGPPVRARGFLPGPELHEGVMARGGGGGACQVSNLVLWLGVHAGLDIVERHRHGLDLFPDDDRDVPFGLGATVFYPHRDLVLRNPHPWPVSLRLWVEDLRLHGEARCIRDPGVRWEVEEAGHRFVQVDDANYRENRIIRHELRGGRRVGSAPLMDNRARVAYPLEPGGGQ